MPRVIINGSLAPVNKPTEVDFDPNRGLVMHLAYESAGANLGGLANTFINSGVAFRWVNSGVKSRLDATVSGGTSGLPDRAQVNWQLLANETQKSIFESDVGLQASELFPPDPAHGSTGLISDIKGAAAALQNNDFSAYNDIIEDLPDDQMAYLNALVPLLLAGTTHFSFGQYVLKRSITVSNFYTGAVTDESLSELIIPFASIFNLGITPAIANSIASIPTPAPHANYLWGWRQLPSTAVTTAQNRVEVSTELWLDNWSLILYGIA